MFKRAVLKEYALEDIRLCRANQRGQSGDSTTVFLSGRGESDEKKTAKKKVGRGPKSKGGSRRAA
jgi:hypothetical protein